MGLITVCTVVGLPAVGVVLMVGLLVIPAAAARFWTDRLGVMTIVSGGIGLLSGVIGVAASAALPTPSDMLSRGWPTGPMITLVAVLIFAASLLLAPRRGVVADLLRHARNRHRISTQNVLRAIYEEIERRGELAHATTVLVSDRIGGSPVGWRRAAAAGLIAQAPASPSAPDRTFHLTRYGLAEAAKVVRAHRVWELFLTEQAAIAPDHVDRDADEIEHVLPHDLIERLEARLRLEGRLPEAVMPESVHPIAPGDGGRA
jgi:manganese/zinc/iron transport system permease protein